MKHILILTGVFCLILSFSLFADDRTWTDRAGKFQVEATLLDFDGKEVKLKKKEDGKVISLDLEKLSLPDQVYVKKTMESLSKSEEPKSVEKNTEPVEKAPESPSEKTTSKRSRKPLPEDEDEENSQNEEIAFRGKIPVTRLSIARQIRTDLTKPGWSISPDPAKTLTLDFPLQPMVFPYRRQDFSTHIKMEGIGFADESPETILTAASFSSHGETKMTQVYVGNLKTLEIQSQLFPARLSPLGLSPDGTKALFIQETTTERRDNKIHLTIADVTQPKFPCIGVLIPFAELKRDRGFDSKMEIEWADWIDNEQILAQSRSGQLVLLKTGTGAAVWTLEGSSISSVTLSPGKKYLLTCCHQNRGSVHVLIETQTGRPLGQLQTPKSWKVPGSGAHFVFSPDGTKLAACDNDWIHLWDATNGAATDSFYVGRVSVYKRNMFWIEPSYLLAGGTLIETKQQLPIWKYSDTQSEDSFFAGKYWHMKRPDSSDSTHFAVLGLTIPHAAMPKLPLLTDSQKYCIRPGITVKLTVDSAIPDHEKVRNYVRSLLRNNGINVADNAAVSLKVTIKAEEPKEVYYGDHFFGRNITGHANFTAHTMSYQFEQDGKVLWATSCRTAAPSTITNEELKNRSLQDIVNEKSKLTSSWYLSVEIPKKIPFDKAGTSSLIPIRTSIGKRH
ncbi:MAG: hypothetical protein LBQ50_01555 [Planctomycetaceae bacterium]|jgi:WD40 repeat protein|nr:hypothetical protein [Planctomycetaceae bacterium]